MAKRTTPTQTAQAYHLVIETRTLPNGTDTVLHDTILDDQACIDRVLGRMGKLYDKGYHHMLKTEFGFEAKHPAGYRVTVSCEDMFGEPSLPEDARYLVDDFCRTLAKQDTVQAEAVKQQAWDEMLDAPSVVGHQVPDGTYTVVFGENDYVTLRVETSDWDKSGLRPDVKTKIEYLAGPNNESDFMGFAFLDRNNGNRIQVWKRFRGNYEGGRLESAVHGLLLDHKSAGETYAMASGRCWRCNRTLTVPASLKRGLGPDCAAKLGY